MAWDALRELTPRRANLRYLEILKLAAEAGEALVDGALRILWEEGETGEGKLNVDTLRQALAEAHQGLPVTNIAVAEVALASLDELTWLERSPHTAVTSTITMTELLVHPYRAANEELVNQYYSLLASYPNLDWVAPDLAIADLAAQLRAQHRLRTPDALQAATAIRRGATAFLTNDAGLARVSEVEVAVLEQLR